MLRKWGTIVLFLLATPMLALAQNTGRLAGVVTDGSTGEPLPGANVILQGTQLGTATDVDGNYFIIGVPVGTYDITASFVGYQPQTIQDVEINAGYTRELNFELMPGAELDEIVVAYERPIIQRDAVGVPRVVSGEDLQNLPLRGVTDVAALQGGVVAREGSDALFIRGGREQEVVYYVDGVRLRGSTATLGINQQAIAEQEMLIGTIPAKYGDAQAGVISITTKSGAEQFFGTLEGITSEGLDGYGHNIGSLSLGGPLFSDRVGFFVSGQYTSMSDANPYGIDTYQLSGDQLASLEANPQVVRATNGSGDQMFIPFPWQAAKAAFDNEEPLTTDSLGTILSLPEGYSLSDGIINAPDTYTADDFSRRSAKSRPLNEFVLNGNISIDPTETVTLRLGGGYESQQEDELAYDMLAYNDDVFYIDEREQWRLYGSLRQRFSQNFFYQIDAGFQDYYYTQRPNGFSSDVEDGLFYGDIDHEYLDVASRYFASRGGGTYEPLYQNDGLATVGRAIGLGFTLPGAPLTRYQKRDLQSFQLSGNATSQIGLHQIEFGGMYQASTERWYYLNTGFGLSRYFADGDCEQSACFDNYEELPFDAFRERAEYWGYDFRGLNEADSEDIEAYYDRTNMDIAPYQPIYYAGYIQDKIEYRDLVLNLGVRVDVFDNNSRVLKDVYAAVPIVRAGDVASRPSGIDSDYAVYFNDADEVVGYRDLSGNFYDTEGSRIDGARITSDLSGQAQATGDPISEAFEDYEPSVTFMPRIGVSFPITDQAIFFASYNVTSQRPTEQEFAPFRAYEEIAPQDQRVPNPKLQPEKTTQYELGFRQRLATNAALTISGFYRTQENKISNRPVLGGFPQYGTYLNADFTTTKGVEVGFDLRRTRNVALTANYTLAFAQGTGSDAQATSVIVWRGEVFPNTISPADFDQRHTVNASFDYRLGEGEGPMILGAPLLENVGVNVLAQYGSGQAY
ncbi:MAG: TonB-dependent receptor, partial [Rhodothermales bacterium]